MGLRRRLEAIDMIVRARLVYDTKMGSQHPPPGAPAVSYCCLLAFYVHIMYKVWT